MITITLFRARACTSVHDGGDSAADFRGDAHTSTTDKEEGGIHTTDEDMMAAADDEHDGRGKPDACGAHTADGRREGGVGDTHATDEGRGGRAAGGTHATDGSDVAGADNDDDSGMDPEVADTHTPAAGGKHTTDDCGRGAAGGGRHTADDDVKDNNDRRPGE